MINVYRYTSDGEGIFSIGKRLLPAELVDEANDKRTWLPKPTLPKGEYAFFLTENGRAQYLATLFAVHQKYLKHIACEELEVDEDEAVYQDEWQVVVRKY